jgi:hypothetical protein
LLLIEKVHQGYAAEHSASGIAESYRPRCLLHQAAPSSGLTSGQHGLRYQVSFQPAGDQFPNSTSIREKKE